MKYSVVIATYNRGADLRETLASLARLRPDGPWEVIVVDNNSTDDTRPVVEAAARTFPVECRYLSEPRQGRSPALNAGIRAARGSIVATTDDDVRVPEDWLTRAAAGLETMRCDFVGGRVLPIWGAPRPAWLSDRGGRHWAVIALLDYGGRALEFGTRVPLGVNMAFRREAFDRVGLFDPHIGRRAGTLLGQEVREWCIRARTAGLRGFYIPEMMVQHIIPAQRLRKAYFRRWFYWRGISRAMLYQRAGLDMEAPEQTSLDFAKVPHVAGVPRYLYRRLLTSGVAWMRAAARRDPVAAFEHELWIWFFAGILRQCWRRERTEGTEGTDLTTETQRSEERTEDSGGLPGRAFPRPAASASAPLLVVRTVAASSEDRSFDASGFSQDALHPAPPDGRGDQQSARQHHVHAAPRADSWTEAEGGPGVSPVADR